MSTPTIRGHQTALKVIKDGKQVTIDTITDFSVDMDSTFMRSKFVGRAIPEGDQAIEGWSGSMNMEVRNSEVEEIIDALVTANLNGIGITEFILLDTENYADGSSVTYAYMDVQLGYGKQAKGFDAKVTKSVKFQSSFRQKI